VDVRVLRIRIPGQWEDGWLYREHLILWDVDGIMHAVSVDSIRGAVLDAFGHHAKVLSDHLVLRSERKTSVEVSDLLRVEGVGGSLFAPLTQQAEGLLFELTGLPWIDVPVEAIPGNVTDVSLYGNRVLVGSDEGLFETQFDPRFPDSAAPLINVSEAAVTSVVTGGGQFAASLGQSGLISREISFGHGEDWYLQGNLAGIHQLADFSRRVTRSTFDLLNYGENSSPELIKAETYSVARENGFRETLIRRFDSPLRLGGLISDALHIAKDSEFETFEVLGNAGYRLLIRQGEEVAVLNIRAFSRGSEELRQDRRFQFEHSVDSKVMRPLTTQELRSGFLVEHVQGVHVLTERGVVELSDELAVQVRSFPQSRRYVDTTLIVQDACVDLVGFVDLDEF
jgi:hypothetical protein